MRVHGVILVLTLVAFALNPGIASALPGDPFDPLLTNGSFDSPSAGAWNDGTGAPVGWHGGTGPVDVGDPGAGAGANGSSNWVDLDASPSQGSIYQDVPTDPGHTYKLSFAYAGNANCEPGVKQMAVKWGGKTIATTRFDTTSQSPSSMGWIRWSSTETAGPGATTRLEFASQTPGNCGPAVDSVSVADQNASAAAPACETSINCSWNLYDDFAASATTNSPTDPFGDSYGDHDTWAFRQAGDFQGALVTHYAGTDFGQGVYRWAGDNGGAYGMGYPWFAINTTPSAVNETTATLDSHRLTLHPGPDEPAALVWRSPIDGAVSVSGLVRDADASCGDGVGWQIRLNGYTPVASGSIANGGSQAFAQGTTASGRNLGAIPVNRGDTLDFFVNSDPANTGSGDYSCDSTRLDIGLRQVLGKLVADSGFRPASNGYSFPDYRSDAHTADLDADAVRKLFGKGVCVQNKATGNCTLTPEAETWRQSENKAIAGGHCEGLAVTADLFYDQIGDPPTPAPFGSPTVHGLKNTSAVQRHLAYGSVFQYLQSVTRDTVDANPVVVLHDLMADLPRGEPMVLGIWQPGFSGGHGLTPFAIADRGGGQYAILVYDNNDPNAIREVEVDTRLDTWQYVMWSGAGGFYRGDASSHTLQLEFDRPGLGIQPCPFCKPSKGKADVAMTKATAAPPGQLFWHGNPAAGHHSDVSIVDSYGHRTGCSGSRCSSGIPGVRLVPLKLDSFRGVPAWENSAPPVFDVPPNLDFKVDLNGDRATHGDSESLTFVRQGISFGVSDLKLAHGDQEQIAVGGRQIALADRSNHGVGPNITYDDSEGAESYQVTVDTSSIDPRAKVELTVDPKRHALALEYAGNHSDSAHVKVFVRRIDGHGHTKTARSNETKLAGGATDALSYTNKSLADGKVQLK